MDPSAQQAQPPSDTMAEETKAQLKDLMAKKDALEVRIRELHQEHARLTGDPSPEKVRLIDEDGFPRADIDIYTVREVRNKLAMAQTDHIGLMKQIEQGLFSYHSQLSAEGAVSSSGSAASTAAGVPAQEAKSGGEESAEDRTSSAAAPELPVEPFTKIRDVLPGSPADRAGLKDGDEVLRFGSVTIDNARTEEDRNRALTLTVQSSIDEPITVWVQRTGEIVSCVLTPRKWEGAGVVGCRFV